MGVEVENGVTEGRMLGEGLDDKLGKMFEVPSLSQQTNTPDL